jgi:ABC-type polar amino acid transport system ATPase subunit
MHVLKKPKAEAVAEAQQLLEKVGILAKQNDYPAQLSGGQQQRAAIARALMMKPQAMLFDEPTSALDPEMVKEVLQVIQTLAHEGMTMLIASHEMHFVRQVAHQVIFLDAGKIAEQGEARDLFQHPKTERLQKFLHSVRIHS